MKNNKKTNTKTMKIKHLKPAFFKSVMDEEVQPIELKDLSKNDVFYEGNILTDNFELVVVNNPRKTKEGWSCKVKNTNGKVIDLYVSENTNFPKPEFYRIPQNLVKNKEGEYVYEVI